MIYIYTICHIKRSSGCILMFIPSHFMCVKKIKSFHHVVGGKLVQIVHNVPSTSSDRPPGYLGLVWKRCAFHASFQGGGAYEKGVDYVSRKILERNLRVKDLAYYFNIKIIYLCWPCVAYDFGWISLPSRIWGHAYFRHLPGFLEVYENKPRRFVPVTKVSLDFCSKKRRASFEKAHLRWPSLCSKSILNEHMVWLYERAKSSKLFKGSEVFDHRTGQPYNLSSRAL